MYKNIGIYSNLQEHTGRFMSAGFSILTHARWSGCLTEAEARASRQDGVVLHSCGPPASPRTENNKQTDKADQYSHSVVFISIITILLHFNFSSLFPYLKIGSKLDLGQYLFFNFADFVFNFAGLLRPLFESGV